VSTGFLCPNSPLSRGTPGAPPASRQLPDSHQLPDSEEPLFACLPPDAPGPPPPRHPAQTPSTLRPRSGAETPKVGTCVFTSC
jgi:hypothetical protein